MSDILSWLKVILGSLSYVKILRALLVLAAGYGLARLARLSVMRLMGRFGSPVQGKVLSRVAFYLIFGMFILSTARQLGFKVNFLLGAAGLLTVAVGFAAQASVSQLISGWFLAAERSFDIGDSVRIDQTIGEVLGIDMLSVKLRTYDNLLIRIPNDNVIKSQVTVLSKFPIRRADIKISVAYKENLDKVRDVLLQVADAMPTALEEPKPLVLVTLFGESGIEMDYRVWTKRGDGFVVFKSNLFKAVKKAFDKHGIEIPFPHRSLHIATVNSDDRPIPVRLSQPPVAPVDDKATTGPE